VGIYYLCIISHLTNLEHHQLPVKTVIPGEPHTKGKGKPENPSVERREGKVESTLSTLMVTRTHLIQSEKMASLGELTAGIAHEIQKPLNFVTNFSEVNKELVDEMQMEMDRGNYNEAKAISNDIFSHVR